MNGHAVAGKTPAIWQYNLLAVPKFVRELERVSNFNQSINLHHHMKDHVEIGDLTTYDAFRVYWDKSLILRQHPPEPYNS